MRFIPAIIAAISLVGCAHCGPNQNDEPYIRTQPGIEYCGAMCQKFTDLNCTGYYEDLDIDCSSDPAYKTMEECIVAGEDAGMVKLTCKRFCEYEMTNSVQLNPKCLSESLQTCAEIETICK